MRSAVPSGPAGVLALALASGLVASTAAGSARAQTAAGPPPLSVDEVIARAIDRPEVGQTVAARRAAARGEQQAAAAFANPELAYEREQLFGPGEAEDVVALTKTFELSGGRRLRESAGAHHRRAVDAEAAAWVADRRAAAREAFYRLLHAQLRRDAVARWGARLEQAVADVTARAVAGDASAYDRLRLTRELARARAAVAREDAARELCWAALAGLIGEDPGADRPWPRVAGELAPDGSPPADAALARALERSPDLLALAERAAAARETARAAGRAWVPELTLSAGYKTAAGDGERAHGFVVGVAAPLPLLSQGRGERAAADGIADELEAERALAAGRIGAELYGLRAAAERLTLLARAHREETSASGAQLLAAAEAGYRGGEVGALELVDAYASDLEAELQLLEIELAAREARGELERLLEGAES